MLNSLPIQSLGHTKMRTTRQGMAPRRVFDKETGYILRNVNGEWADGRLVQMGTYYDIDAILTDAQV